MNKILRSALRTRLCGKATFSLRKLTVQYYDVNEISEVIVTQYGNKYFIRCVKIIIQQETLLFGNSMRLLTPYISHLIAISININAETHSLTDHEISRTTVQIAAKLGTQLLLRSYTLTNKGL